MMKNMARSENGSVAYATSHQILLGLIDRLLSTTLSYILSSMIMVM